MKCNFCDGEMEFKTNSDILIPIGNPKKLKMKANFYRCVECGKELFKQDESLRIAKLVDEINDKLNSPEKGEVKTLKVEEGTIIC